MKPPLKIVYGVAGAILILVILTVTLVHLFGNRALKAGIEAAATKTLNVKVAIDDVDLSIMGGKLGLQNLVIGNPPGYQHEKMLELKDAEIAVDIKSLLSDVVNIREIKLDGVNVVLEQRGISSNNIQDVIKSIPAKKEQPSEPSGKKLHIDNLEITNVTVNVKLLPVPGKTDTLTLKLAPIKMTNLGDDNKLTTAVLSSKIMLAITDGIAEQGTGVLPKEIVGSLASELKKVEDLTDALLGQSSGIPKTGEDADKEAVEKRKEIEEKATGIFKRLLKPKEEE
jgi:hypothetical protein